MTCNVLVAIRRARLSLTLLAALSVTLLWASPAKAGTTITQNICPVLITQAGEYDLGTDVGPCLVDGIDIVASGVTLHLDGHTITGSADCGSDSGIRVLGLIPLTLVRILGPGTITGFANGVVADNSAGSYVKFVTINQQLCTGPTGIWIRNLSSQWKAEGNVVRGGPTDPTAIGISLDGVNDNDLVRNNVNDTIFLTNSSNNIIDNNTANGNIEGIELEIGSNNNEIHSNTTNNNIGTGILVNSGAMANNITGNTALNNAINDLFDNNLNCDNNKWKGNKFNSANQSCIH